MTEKRDQYFNAIKTAPTLTARERIAAEWLRDIASDSTVLVGEFITDCAGYFGSAAYCCNDADTAEVVGYGIRGAYLIGAATAKHKA